MNSTAYVVVSLVLIKGQFVLQHVSIHSEPAHSLTIGHHPDRFVATLTETGGKDFHTACENAARVISRHYQWAVPFLDNYSQAVLGTLGD